MAACVDDMAVLIIEERCHVCKHTAEEAQDTSSMRAAKKQQRKT